MRAWRRRRFGSVLAPQPESHGCPGILTKKWGVASIRVRASYLLSIAFAQVFAGAAVLSRPCEILKSDRLQSLNALVAKVFIMQLVFSRLAASRI